MPRLWKYELKGLSSNTGEQVVQVPRVRQDPKTSIEGRVLGMGIAMIRKLNACEENNFRL